MRPTNGILARPPGANGRERPALCTRDEEQAVAPQGEEQGARRGAASRWSADRSGAPRRHRPLP